MQIYISKSLTDYQDECHRKHPFAVLATLVLVASVSTLVIGWVIGWRNFKLALRLLSLLNENSFLVAVVSTLLLQH